MTAPAPGQPPRSHSARRPRTLATTKRARPNRSAAPTASLLERLASAIGLRTLTVVDGVRYRARTTEPIRRALSRKGRGYKDFDVLFPSRKTMRIRLTPDRLYHDLTGPTRPHHCTHAEPLIRPGMRILELHSGTGTSAAWLADRVGPSGAVVALERDGESVRYARRRFPLDNTAFEIGGIEALSGEIDGAFDGVIAARPVHPAPKEAAGAGDSDADISAPDISADDTPAAPDIAELWRLVTPGGWLLAALHSRPPAARDEARDLAATLLPKTPEEGSIPEIVEDAPSPDQEDAQPTQPAETAAPIHLLPPIEDGPACLLIRRPAPEGE